MMSFLELYVVKLFYYLLVCYKNEVLDKLLIFYQITYFFKQC